MEKELKNEDLSDDLENKHKFGPNDQDNPRLEEGT